MDDGIASDVDARREFENVAATCDQEMREVGVTIHVHMTYGDRKSITREVGALDRWVASGYRYWGRALADNGIPNEVDVEDTGGCIYVPFVKIGEHHRVWISDHDHGTFLAGLAKNPQDEDEPRESDDIRHAHGLTGAEVIDFVRSAIAEVQTTPDQPEDMLGAAEAALNYAGVNTRTSYLHLAIEATDGLIVVTEDEAWVAARYAPPQDFDEGHDPAERLDSADLPAVVAWIAERAT